MWVVDQHVAHERAILDRLHDSDGPATVQSLLVPEVVELSPAEAEPRRRASRSSPSTASRPSRSARAPCGSRP